MLQYVRMWLSSQHMIIPGDWPDLSHLHGSRCNKAQTLVSVDTIGPDMAISSNPRLDYTMALVTAQAILTSGALGNPKGTGSRPGHLQHEPQTSIQTLPVVGLWTQTWSSEAASPRCPPWPKVAVQVTQTALATVAASSSVTNMNSGGCPNYRLLYSPQWWQESQTSTQTPSAALGPEIKTWLLAIARNGYHLVLRWLACHSCQPVTNIFFIC